MATPPRSSPTPAERAWRPSRGRLALVLALALAGAGLLMLLWMPSWSFPEPVQAATPAAPPAPSAALPTQAPAPAPLPPVPDPDPERDADPTRDLSSYVARGDNPSMGQVIERLHERGIYSGLGAFNPPGTKPPLVGLAVPPDFPLPPGYVRHHQATDDGQAIDAILMFAPGFQLLDASNQPIPMPANRVVPPELAPPGLPIRRIAIPTPTGR